MRVKGGLVCAPIWFHRGILGTACYLSCRTMLATVMLEQLLASRVVVSFADSSCSKAVAQVAPNSVFARSSVKSSRLLDACLLDADAFASACSSAAATHLSILLFDICKSAPLGLAMHAIVLT